MSNIPYTKIFLNFYSTLSCVLSSPGCCAAPANAVPLPQCEPTPGEHWCYRMQTGIGTWGDYMWNVSQNVPSVPLPCAVKGDGVPINDECPLCPVGVGTTGCPKNDKPGCSWAKNGCNNCNLIIEQAAVSIPILRPPPPSGHECHTSNTTVCNVCKECCSNYIADGSQCDNCVASKCH